MYITTEGIILRQTKTVGNRRMITLLSKDYGKISCGTSITEGGRNKTALALRPFTHGRYELYKSKDSCNISGAETLTSYYAIGEDIDKYLQACYVLELTDRVLLEDQPSPQTFELLASFMEMLLPRKKAYSTLVIGYQVKLLAIAGVAASGGLEAAEEPLLSEVNADIIQSVKYFENHRLKDLENIAVSPDLEYRLKHILKVYYADNLGVKDLNSESVLV